MNAPDLPEGKDSLVQNDTYEFKVIATQNKDDLEDKLNKYGRDGYRIVNFQVQATYYAVLDKVHWSDAS